MTGDYNVGQIVALARHAAMSTSYKPALLKALVRLVRRGARGRIPLLDIGAEFVVLYWNQTIVFHLRQAATISKEPEVIHAIRETATAHRTRDVRELPPFARTHLDQKMARILTIDVLRRFHASAPDSMPPLYEWTQGDAHVTLPDNARAFLSSENLVLESLVNLWWARYLERVNVLTPYIVQKVERDGARRAALQRFLKILRSLDVPLCFYCERPFDATRKATVDHVIPWSFLLTDPLWDLVLACGRCNSSKSDALPTRDFVDKLALLNVRRSGVAATRERVSALIDTADVGRYYEAALSVEWPSAWRPGQAR